MSKKIHSQDSNFEEIWKEMDEIEPLTPPPADVEDSYRAYKEAALSDAYMFGEYNGYEAYDEEGLTPSFFYKYLKKSVEMKTYKQFVAEANKSREINEAIGLGAAALGALNWGLESLDLLIPLITDSLRRTRMVNLNLIIRVLLLMQLLL